MNISWVVRAYMFMYSRQLLFVRYGMMGHANLAFYKRWHIYYKVSIKSDAYYCTLISRVV